ncbi:unnamed protein product, partial [Laminaria digitata]
PSGFICGFPTANGDLYGGALYLASAAVGPQASALLRASARWGEGVAGKKQIPVPVCKVKYQPFRRQQQRQQQQQHTKSGHERMYACHLHHYKRKALIDRSGPREGWEAFDQW